MGNSSHPLRQMLLSRSGMPQLVSTWTRSLGTWLVCLAWTPDSNTIASGSDDKAIRLWDRVTGRPKTTTRKTVAGQEMAPLKGHHNYIHCLAFSPKGNILASGSYDEAVFLWDVRAGRLMRSLPAHSDPVSGIDFCRDGTLVVSCSTDGLMYDP
jgi:COMPASS component SWD3